MTIVPLKDCLLRMECCGKVTKFKKIEDSVHKPLYDRMHEKLQKDKNYTRFLTKRRSSTAESVLGTLINYHSMKRGQHEGHEKRQQTCFNVGPGLQLKKIPEVHQPETPKQCPDYEP